MAPRGLAVVGFLVMTVLFGVNFVAVRVSNAELTPFWGAAMRFLVATALLAGVVAARRIPWPRGRALAGAVIYGALAVGALYALVYWALVTAPASPAAIVFSTIPLMTLLVAWGARQEAFHWRGLAGAVIAFAGAAIVFAEELRADVPALAMVALLLAALASALASVVVKGFPRSHPFAMNAVGMGAGALMLLVLALVVPAERVQLPVRTATWVAVGYLVASSIIAFALLVWLIGEWGASRVSYSGVLIPIVTTLVATTLAGESVSLTLVVGGVVVLAGVYVGALSGQKAAAAPVPPPAPRGGLRGGRSS